MRMFANMKRVGKATKSMWHYRKLLGFVSIFLIGLILICTAAFVLKGTPLVIALTVGGILIIISWGKMTFNAAVKRSIRLHEAEKLKEENRQLLEKESILEQQLEEARSRKLQVMNVQPILDLGILEADCQISRCFDLLIDKNGEIITEESNGKETGYLKAFMEGFLGLRGNIRFVGTLMVNFTATYGIKLQDLKIRRDDNSKTIYVAGAEPTYTGCKKFPQTHWEGCIVLSEKGGEWIMDDEAMKLEAPCKDICRNYIEDSLQKGPEELEWLKIPLQNTVKHLLQMMISPPEYSLVFVDKIEEEAVPFFEYAAGLGLDRPRLEGGVG